MAQTLLQPHQVCLFNGKMPTDGAIDVKSQWLNAIKVCRNVRHAVWQQGKGSADVTTEFVGYHLEIAERGCFVNERVTAAEFVIALCLHAFCAPYLVVMTGGWTVRSTWTGT